MTLRAVLMALIAFLFCNHVHADGTYYTSRYQASDQPGKLIYNADFHLWIPPSDKPLRGIIIHQHGCGRGANVGGQTAAYDLHWQALARKWNCGLLGPVYDQDDKQDCRKWCDPRNGSSEVFLNALKDLAEQAKRPEIETVPWCVWGHSGGGFWGSILLTMYPDRCVSLWCRSGAAYATWEKREIPKPEIAASCYQVPIAFNPGVRERDDERFSGAWTGAIAMFNAFRKEGAPVCFVPDPRTSHECGDSRYCAIPYFDTCLALRLSNDGSPTLKSVDMTLGIQGDWSKHANPIENLKEDETQLKSFLPGKEFTSVWLEYLKKGSCSDTTPPPSPTNIAAKQHEGKTIVTWEALADFESGIQQFLILRDGKEVGRVPEKPTNPFGKPLFQSMSYHDTPAAPLAKMEFIEEGDFKDANYSVVAINTAGLQSN